MAVQVNPITQSLPATTAIQDPAVRRFAQAVDDALRALRSEEGAVESLKKAADAMNGAISGGTPPSIAQWLFSSELYQKLTSEIARIDVEAKQDLLDEALARQTAIDEINATLATIQSTAAYDPLVTYAIGDMVTYDGKLYQAILATTGNLPTNTTYWKKVGDYATLGDVVAAHTLEIDDLDSRITTDEGNLTAEIASRQALATQVRGTYTGTDITLVSQGLMYSERVARSTADSTEVAARQSLSAKLTGSNDPSGLTIETLASGLIFDEKQARVSGDGANASSISALRAQVGVTEAGALTTGLILDEKNVRASNDLAIVSAVNTALAQITGVSTSISQSGENLIANWSQAQASKWNQIESEVLTAGGQTIRAALQQEANTRATLAGQVSATWTVKAEVDSGTGKPYIAGLALGASGQGGATTSEFIIRADALKVVMPGYGEHVPFAIGPSGADFLGNVTGSVAGTAANALVNTANNAATTAASAQTSANTANAALADIAADNKLTPAEKQSIRKEWDTIYAERAGIRAQADSFGITTEKTNYDDEFQALGTYLNGGAAYTIGATPPSWITDANLSTTTTIVGATFRANWSNLYADRQALLNKISAEAAKKADWSSVSGKTGFAALDGKITSSNVTTYIDYAAIGNAQIGGNLWSTNWNYAGGTGWLLDRSGNFYGNNIYARGDIEASSLKANTAMVDTLHIQGNAVTVPVSAFTAGAISANSYPVGWSTVVIQTAWIDAGGSPVFVTGTCAVFFNPNISSFFDYFELVAPSGAVITRSGRMYTNNGNSDTVSISGVSYEAGTYQFRARTYLNASYSQSSWEISYRCLSLLGTKR